MKIDIHNYEAYLVDHLHHELPADQVIALERLMASHPEIQHEFELLKQTLLLPDEDIVFPDKALLRKPAQYRTRVFFLPRIAAAAAILAIITTAVVLMIKRSPHPQEAVGAVQLQPAEQQTNAPQPATPIEVQIPAKVNPVTQLSKAMTNDRTKPVEKLAQNRKNKRNELPQALTSEQVATSTVPPVRMQTPTITPSPEPESKAITYEAQSVMPNPEAASAPLPLDESPSEKILQIDKRKQPGLFKAIAGVMKFSRKVKSTRQEISQSGLVLLMGKRKVVSVN